MLLEILVDFCCLDLHDDSGMSCYTTLVVACGL